MANKPMRISHFKLQGVCLALALTTLAGCGERAVQSPAAAPKSVAELPSTDLRAQALAKAKGMSSAERRAVLAEARWAKETEIYADLMKKAVIASNKLSDKETLALGDKMYKAHAALLKATGRDQTRVLYLLRAEAVGTREGLQELGKFSSKLRTVRGALQLGDATSEQRRQVQIARMQARQAEARANAPATAGRPTAPTQATTTTPAASAPAASAPAPAPAANP